MQNPNSVLKKWFYTTLSGMGFEVYDGMAPESAGNEYIVMDARTSNQEQGKSGYTNSCSVDIDIVTKNANFGYKRSETISNLILSAINSDIEVREFAKAIYGEFEIKGDIGKETKALYNSETKKIINRVIRTICYTKNAMKNHDKQCNYSDYSNKTKFFCNSCKNKVGVHFT